MEVTYQICARMTDEKSMMRAKEDYRCPRCGYRLVSVHAMEGSKRRVIALSCPEPYCDHMQSPPRGMEAKFKQRHAANPDRLAEKRMAC